MEPSACRYRRSNRRGAAQCRRDQIGCPTVGEPIEESEVVDQFGRGVPQDALDGGAHVVESEQRFGADPPDDIRRLVGQIAKPRLALDEADLRQMTGGHVPSDRQHLGIVLTVQVSVSPLDPAVHRAGRLPGGVVDQHRPIGTQLCELTTKTVQLVGREIRIQLGPHGPVRGRAVQRGPRGVAVGDHVVGDPKSIDMLRKQVEHRLRRTATVPERSPLGILRLGDAHYHTGLAWPPRRQELEGGRTTYD